MSHSRFSASAEPSLSSASSSSTSDHRRCSEYEQIHHIAHRPSPFRRSLPSLTKLQIPATPLHQTLSSQTTFQKKKAQVTSMGYSKLFNLGYLSATGALRSSG